MRSYVRRKREELRQILGILRGDFNPRQHQVLYENYAYILGLYLGDGHITDEHKQHKLTYPRYFFTNMSVDIRQMFYETAEKLNLQWRQTNAISVAISRREDVAWLDEHIGAKA